MTDLLENFKPLDLALIVICLFSAYQGFKRGLIIEFFSSVSMFIALYICIKFWSQAMALSITWMPKINPSIRSWVVFGLFFAGNLVIISTLARVLSYILSLSILGWIDRLLGAIWGASKVIIGISLFLSFVEGYLGLDLSIAEASALVSESKLLSSYKDILSFIADTLKTSLASASALE